MSIRTTNYVELLIFPPFLQCDAKPLDLKKSKHIQDDGDGEEVDKEGDVELVYNKLAKEEEIGGKEIIT